MKFRPYESKRITRMAFEIPAGAQIASIGPNTYLYEGITFKAYQLPAVGDYVVRLSEEDTYHVARDVFFERNIVEDAAAPKGLLSDAVLAERMATREFPRVTEAVLESIIVGENYFVDETLTICVLKLRNGFKVLGESACVDPRNFDEAIGRTYARKNAFSHLWKLEGYALAERIRIAAENA